MVRVCSFARLRDYSAFFMLERKVAESIQGWMVKKKEGGRKGSHNKGINVTLFHIRSDRGSFCP